MDAPNKEDLVGVKPERISYAELDEMAYRLASFLLDNGVFKDSGVLVQLPNTLELIATYFAVWRASAFISPVPMQWRGHELRHVCRVLQPSIFITADAFKGYSHREMAARLKDEFPSIKKVVTFSELYEVCRNYPVREDVDEASEYCNANDVAVVQWTSGTEAEPKACPLTHNNWGFLRFLYDGENYSGGLLSDGDVIMNPAPIVNMTGVGVGLIPWLHCVVRLFSTTPSTPFFT